jgi:hypothetical protein
MFFFKDCVWIDWRSYLGLKIIREERHLIVSRFHLGSFTEPVLMFLRPRRRPTLRVAESSLSLTLPTSGHRHRLAGSRRSTGNKTGTSLQTTRPIRRQRRQTMTIITWYLSCCLQFCFNNYKLSMYF